MNHTKTFEAINKLKDIELELHRLKNALEMANKALDSLCAPPPKQEQGEPVAWVDLLKEAQQIVESKFLWKRFIDGTPLANDIACWMADFAQQHTTPQQRKPLTDEQMNALWFDTNKQHGSVIWRFARAIEAAHGIKEKNT